MSNSSKSKLMKSKSMKLVALSLALGTLLTSLTGCGGEEANAGTFNGMENFATVNEVRDYYAEELSYDTIITRRINENVTKYVKEDVDTERAQQLKDYVNQIEAVLSADEYKVPESKTEDGVDLSKLVSENEFYYLKGQLDSLALNNGVVGDIKQAKGFYFVDVTYNVSAQAAGTFKPCADMAGLNGLWTTDILGKDIMSEYYIEFALRKLNDYFYDNKLAFEAQYDKGSMTFKIIESTANLTGNKTLGEDADKVEIEAGDLADNNNADIEKPNTDKNTAGDITVNTADLAGKPSILEKEISEQSVLDPSRRVTLDINFINNVVGAVGDSASLPKLDLVYNIPAANGISGYGIYPEGTNGFFGFDRSKLAGTVTLRYVFKDSIDGSGNIIGTNIYIANQEITTGFSTTDTRVNVADFLKTKLEETIERNDRLQSNGDISGLMCGGLYEDKGAAILRAFKTNNTNILKHTSTIRNILARDTEHNAYLLEVETAAIDGAIDCSSYGMYRDTYYVVVQQQGQEFVIADSVKMKRETIKEPDIAPDSTTAKRLVALNLSDVVTDDAKSQIGDLLDTLYTAGTNRILNVDPEQPMELTAGDQTITLERGLNQCFNMDREMLSEEDYNYLNQELQSDLIAHGTEIDSVHRGKVYEWIGGYKDEQAEFMAQELITYTGLNKGYYMDVYYLVSNRDGQWVIDERNIIEEYEVEGTDLQTIEGQVS